MMENEMNTDLASLLHRVEELNYLMIEAEEDLYFEYATELEYVEAQVDQLTQEIEVLDIYNNRGII
mgnify:CR=1 FL=1